MVGKTSALAHTLLGQGKILSVGKLGFVDCNIQRIIFSTQKLGEFTNIYEFTCILNYHTAKTAGAIVAGMLIFSQSFTLKQLAGD